MKVQIQDRCEFCDGEAYIFVCEDVDARGEIPSVRIGRSVRVIPRDLYRYIESNARMWKER